MSSSTQPGFTVTLREIYEEMRDSNTEVRGEIRGLTTEVRELASEIKESRKTDDDHERRIRTLERWMWGLPISIIAAIAASLKAFLG